MTVPASLDSHLLPALLARASDTLRNAVTAAQVLEAREAAGVVYDAAKRAARLSRARAAHADVLAAVHRTQADALEIEATAESRLADEYDAAQERGDVARRGRRENVPDGNIKPTVGDLGIDRKQVFQARQLRDAMAENPGIVRRALDQMLAEGDEPTRTALRRELAPLAQPRANLRAAVGTASATKEERGNNLYETPVEAMRVLLAVERFSPIVWEPACGRGAILRPLEAAGYLVRPSDLVDYGTADSNGECQAVIDFLDTEPGFAAGSVNAGDDACPDIVTNPPYGAELNRFVAHALRVHRPRRMALLLNLNFLCGFDDADRVFAMDENPPARVHVFSRRLPMMHRDGWEGPEAQSRMNTAWFVWELRAQADGSEGYAGPTLMRRVDWKDFESGPAKAGSEAPVALSKDEKAGELPTAAGPRQRKPRAEVSA